METVNQRLKVTRAKIFAKRRDLKLKQEWVASKLNISQNAYSKIEIGTSEISLKRLMEIADVFECEVTELIN